MVRSPPSAPLAGDSYDPGMTRQRRFDVKTQQRSQFIEVTGQVEDFLREAGVKSGLVTVYVPHTTAGVTINENADPDVVHDMLGQLDRMVPWEQPFYRHAEGNSAAHVKASMMGSSVTIPVGGGRLALGRWLGVYRGVFDGARTREVIVVVSGEGDRD